MYLLRDWIFRDCDLQKYRMRVLWQFIFHVRISSLHFIGTSPSFGYINIKSLIKFWSCLEKRDLSNLIRSNALVQNRWLILADSLRIKCFVVSKILLQARTLISEAQRQAQQNDASSSESTCHFQKKIHKKLLLIEAEGVFLNNHGTFGIRARRTVTWSHLRNQFNQSITDPKCVHITREAMAAAQYHTFYFLLVFDGQIERCQRNCHWKFLTSICIFRNSHLNLCNMSKLSLTTRKNISENEAVIQDNLKKMEVRTRHIKGKLFGSRLTDTSIDGEWNSLWGGVRLGYICPYRGRERQEG